MAASDDVTTHMLNKAVLDKLGSRNDTMRKEAMDDVDEYIRIRMREDGFTRRIMEPENITADRLDRQVDTPLPCKIVDIEPESPGAKTAPFATLPINEYINVRRYRIEFSRIMSPKFQSDREQLLTNNIDIRQVLSDNSVKDMMTEEDSKFIALVNNIIGSPGSIVTETGNIQYVIIAGGVTRANFKEALKVLPRGGNKLVCSTVLMNNVTYLDFAAFGRDEIGGDKSQDYFRSGFQESEIMGRRIITTNKRDLVPDGTLYMFAPPKFIGRFYILTDITMYIKCEAYMLSFFSYMTEGLGIGNVASVARADLI